MAAAIKSLTPCQQPKGKTHLDFAISNRVPKASIPAAINSNLSSESLYISYLNHYSHRAEL